MGAWGTESFANDDAMDWIADLEAAKDLRAVRAALDAVPRDGADYIEAPIGSVALAAAEVVAALRGRAAVKLPEEVTAWVRANPQVPDASLVDMAARVVKTVSEDEGRSELRQLWGEADPEDHESWHASVADLRRRLS
jgi:hypothetical protein